VVRRSARKSYLLAAFLAAVVAMAAYAASLPVWARMVPAYASTPTSYLPAALAALALAIAFVSWLNARSWTYRLDSDVAVVQRSLLGHQRFGIPLNQITTLQLKQSAVDRLLGVGTVELTARDSHGHERHLVMEDLPHPRQTYDQLTKLLGRAARARARTESDPDA
jgi:uncharacterized membrane protein YdbT with pleckstrin-like domain